MTCPDPTVLQACAEAKMIDACVLVQVIDTDAVNEYGHPITGEVETSSVCTLDLRASKEWLNAEARVYDAKIRLPLDTEILNIDHLRITERYGVEVDELRYEFIGDPRRGLASLVADLRSSPNG